MAHVVANRVKETTATTGTATIQLAGAVSRFQTFLAGVGNGNTTFYGVKSGTVDWEIGVGTVASGTPNTLTRDTVLASSASGSKITLSGTSEVYTTIPATGFPWLSQATFADKDHLVFNNTTKLWDNFRAHYGMAFSAPQTVAYDASQVIGHHAVAVGITIPANFGAYNGRTSKAGGTANATGSTVISVESAVSGTPNTFSQIGTITIGASGVSATFATTSGTAKTFSAGDIIRLVMPGTVDATFAGFYCTLVGHET